MTRKHFLALVTLTLLVAAFLRIWQLAIYPPGPHYDEAAELLIARSIAFGGARFFPMVEAYQGREVLYYYLSVPLLTFINNGMFSLRVLSVYCNLITIAASIALGRSMFRGRRGVIVGLAVGVLMTLSFPMIWMSRQTFRSSTLPLMQALALLFLFKGLRVGARHAVPLLIIGGLFAGGAVYTYNSSRLFPFWLLLGGVALLWFDRSNSRRRLGQGAIFFVTLAITAAPMAVYAIQRPDVFWGRLSEVTEADKSVTLAQSIVLHLKMFFLSGDPYFRYNVAGRPYFTWPEGILLLLGIGLAVWQIVWRKLALQQAVGDIRTAQQRALERAAYVLALIAPLMVIPSVISVGGLPPSNTRSLGMVPLIFVLVGIGAAWVIEWVERSAGAWQGNPSPQLTKNGSASPSPTQAGRGGKDRAHSRAPLQEHDPLAAQARHASPLQNDSVQGGARYFVPLLTVIVLIVGGAGVWDVYFRWASDPALFYEADADISLAAKWLVAQHVDANTPVYLAARDKGHPTVMIELVPPITWLGTDSLFRPPPGVTGLYIFPRSAPPPADWAAWLAPGAISDLPLGPDGRTAFQAFRISGDAPLPVDAAAVTARSRYLTFVGLDSAPIPAGSSGTITMAWRIDVPPPDSDFTPLLMLEDAQGSLIFRGDAYMAGTDEWRAGETLIQRMAVQIPPATPPGEYTLKIAWVGRASNTYAPYFNESGGLGAVWSPIGTLTVKRPTSFPDPAALSIAVRQPSEIAPGVTLLGWNNPPTSLRPGETLPLTLYLQASGTTRFAFTLSGLLHNGQSDTTLWTGQPIDDRYPADQWAAGEVLADRERWTIPRDQAAGDYNLEITVDGKSVEIALITVAGVPRLLEAPPVEHVIKANLGNKVQLYGYTIQTIEGKMSLEIVWKALDNIPIDYKVFVHLVDRDSVILAQRDAMPQSNLYPTSLWIPGEYVVDRYELPVLDGGTALHIGLYSPDDGTRLPIYDEQQKATGDYVLVSYKNQFITQ